MDRERTVDTQAGAPRSTFGERLRQLRIARGLTQAELAGTRFSKQYVSEMERGVTHPNAETTAWLAERLGADPHFLAAGLSSKEWERADAAIARAEAAVEAHANDEALEILDGLLSPGAAPELELRAWLAEASARMYRGEVDRSLQLLQHARKVAEGPEFTDVDRADVLFRLGCCRYKLSSTTTALALFDAALTLAEGSGLPCDRLRSRIHGWRSRCYRRQRDWEAAREDVERALELAEGLGDRRGIADAYFLGSLVAEREGRWVLARQYGERARAIYEEIDDRVTTGKLLTALGAFTFLLGKPVDATAYLKEAVQIALEAGSDADAAQAISSLAQVHLRTGDVATAEEQARRALEILGGRVDYLDEIGNTHLVLGRALLEQERFDEAEIEFGHADRCFEQLASASHRAAAWAAQADLAVRRGDETSAVRLYERAVQALQDFHF